MKPINVGLLGIGTVGGGTFTVLKRNEEEITRRAGRPIRITAWPTRTSNWQRA
jgi:homoserine dehydrogenase